MTDGAWTLAAIVVAAVATVMLVGAGFWWYVLIVGFLCLCWGLVSAVEL
jgi:hypothetical protein